MCCSVDPCLQLQWNLKTRQHLLLLIQMYYKPKTTNIHRIYIQKCDPLAPLHEFHDIFMLQSIP